MLKLLVGNPWLLLGVLAALLGSHSAAYWRGGVHAENALKAEAADDAAVREETRKAAMLGAAEAIAKIEVKHVTIRQSLEKEIHEKPVYRDCRHSPDGLRLVNEALVGGFAPGGGVVSGSGTDGQ